MEILLIEDNPTEVRMLKNTLRKIIDGDLDIHHCSTVSDGTSYLRENKDRTDLVLLDLKLADSPDWEETIKSIAPYTYNVPVVVLSGNEDKNVALETLKHGVEDFIVKGTTKHELQMFKETIEFALIRHKGVERLSDTAKKEEECIRMLTGGYSVKKEDLV